VRRGRLEPAPVRTPVRPAPGRDELLPQEEKLLSLYAKHAAAVLDTALALRESSRRHEHVSALLSLSQAMARADSITEVAHEVTDAMIELVSCERSSMWLVDAGTGNMRREWTAGAAPAARRASLGMDDTPYLARMLQDPRPMFFDHEEQDPILVAMMTDAHLVALAVVPIIAHGIFLALHGRRRTRGEEGGRIVAQGTPEQVARVKKSYTGQALAGYFAGNGKRSA